MIKRLQIDPGTIARHCMWCLTLLTTAQLSGLPAQPAHAFPKFEEWISRKAGFQTDCSYCHTNRDGPSGSGAGQIGSLSDTEREKLRTADSPVLNEFGRSLIAQLGYAGVLKGLQDPSAVAEQMKRFDLDGDGVSDGAEMEHGTLPHDALSAPASLIWPVRLERDATFLAAIAVFSGIGAIGLLGLARATGQKRRDNDG